MRNKEANWFEVIVRFDKTMEDGMTKKVKELYVVDALTIGEAEEKILKEISHYISGEADVIQAKKTPYTEIFFSDSERDDMWYKVKIAFITIDEKTEKEKKTSVTYLVQGSTVDSAAKNVATAMSDSIVDFVIQNIDETKILDVFE